jgi:hypothetical protein
VGTDLHGYELWLRKEGYQPSTIEATLRNLRSAEDGPVRPHHHAHIRRYLRFVAETRRQPLGSKFTKWLRLKAFDASIKRRRHGARVKSALTRQEWTILKKRLRQHKDPVSRLLLAYMLCPYRVGEFLRLDVVAVGEDDIQDKISRDWLGSMTAELRKKGLRHKRVYDTLCTTERCAYARLRRKLQIVCEGLGYEADLDTLYKSFHELKGAA